jgi:hypothetical protein
MLTTKQQKDLETVKYFIPRAYKNVHITEDDEKMFLEYSEQGLHKEFITQGNLIDIGKYKGFNALCDGKKWRGIHIHELYEQGILDGSMPYCVILEDMPRVVVDFLKKEMFGGIDSNLIEKCYANYTNI